MSISHDNGTNVTAENDTHSLLHLQEDPDISSQQVDHNQVTVAFDNQSIFAAEKKNLEKKRVKEKITYSISLNGLAIPEINRPGKPENVVSKILSMAKSKKSGNLIGALSELQFTICIILYLHCVSSFK